MCMQAQHYSTLKEDARAIKELEKEMLHSQKLGRQGPWGHLVSHNAINIAPPHFRPCSALL